MKCASLRVLPTGKILSAMGAAMLLAVSLSAAPVRASTVVLHFDSVDASAASVPAGCYLAGFGLSLSNVSPTRTQVVIVDNRNEYGGGSMVPPSPPNMVAQVGSNDPDTYTLNFATLQDSVSFTRPELIAGSSGITFPQWTATAFNSAGVQLSSVGEGLIASFSNVPPKTFTLTGPGIANIRIDSVNFHFAAFSALILDDLTLNSSQLQSCGSIPNGTLQCAAGIATAQQYLAGTEECLTQQLP